MEAVRVNEKYRDDTTSDAEAWEDEHCILESAQGGDQCYSSTLQSFKAFASLPYLGMMIVILVVILLFTRDITAIGGVDGDMASMVTVVDEECSCFQPSRECCERLLLCNHKFGFILSKNLYGPFNHDISRMHINLGSFPNSTAAKDYRHVVLVRNMYDAIVSGYLYHQAGHECWLSPAGRPWRNKRPRHGMEWEKYLRDIDFDLTPTRNRSICKFLADEDLNFGMRVYIHVALQTWYYNIERYFIELERRRQMDPVERTMVVCFEDITNASKQAQIFDSTMDFLFPGGHEQREIPVQPQAYSGGHASSHDPATRRLLLSLVHELDESAFSGALQRLNSLYDCGNEQ
ncbi:hypothetical protein MPSEU_001081700 [Mayamaea pseudoterrestris]|nr:hypothetical protein MPSEU_001081700 [Mayamaea pseudoterrestris]